MNYYPNYNQFYSTGIQQPMQQIPKVQPMIEPQYQPQYTQPQQVYKQLGLQGKSVDNVEVVKAMDIPLDGTISYFPITDGSAIVTKQLQQDGSSKTIIYKPITEKEVEKTPKFITQEELDESMKKVDNSSFKNEIRILREQVQKLTDELKEIKDNNEKMRRK